MSKPLSPQRALQRLMTAPLLVTLVRGTGIAFSLQMLGAVVIYLSQVLLARWLGTVHFGHYMYASSWAQMLAVLGALGTPLGMLKFLPEYVSAEDWPHVKGVLRVFRLTPLVAGAALGGTVALSFAALAPPQVNVGVLVLGLVGVPFFALKNVQARALRSLGAIALAYGLPYVTQPTLLLLCVGVLHLWLGRTLTAWHGVLAMLGALGAVSAVQAWALHKKIGVHLQRVRAEYALRPWLQTILPLVVVDGATEAMSRVDILLVGLILSSSQTGIYAAATRIASLVSLVLFAVNAVTAPRIAPLYRQGDRAALQRLVTLATALSLALAAAMTLGMVVLAGPLLQLFGAEFVVGRRALMILTLGHFANAASGPVNELLHLTVHQRASGVIAVGGVMLNVALNLALTPHWGLEGAALATALALLAQNATLYFFVRHKLKINTLAFGRLVAGAR